MAVVSTFGRNFWRQAVERAVKTAAQAALLIIPADAFNVLTPDWQTIAGTAAGGAVLSLLTSIATAGVGQRNDPSAVAMVSDVRRQAPGAANGL